MKNSLFRDEAIQHQLKKLDGDILVKPGIPYVLTSLILIGWLIAVVVFLTTQEYSRKATVTGWLEPASGVIRHYADAPGVVSQVHVTLGDLVYRGQPLVTLGSHTMLGSGIQAEKALISSLLQQRSGLLERLHQSAVLHQLSMDKQESALVSLRYDISLTENLRRIVDQRRSIAGDKLSSAKNLLNSHHLSKTDYDAIQSSYLSVSQESVQLQRELAQLTRQAAETEETLQRLPAEFAITTLSVSAEVEALQRQVTQAERQREVIIVAATDGVISQLPVKVGQTLTMQQSVATLLPGSADVIANVFVPVRDAGFLAVGQPISLRYDAYPFQKFGVQQGTVERISSSLVLPGEIANVPVPINEPAYLITAKLDAQSLNAFGQPVTLKAGMTFSADIALSQRTLIEWLFEPLLSLKGRV